VKEEPPSALQNDEDIEKQERAKASYKALLNERQAQTLATSTLDRKADDYGAMNLTNIADYRFGRVLG